MESVGWLPPWSLLIVDNGHLINPPWSPVRKQSSKKKKKNINVYFHKLCNHYNIRDHIFPNPPFGDCIEISSYLEHKAIFSS